MAEQSSDTLSITLRFGSWTLPMTVRREEEYVYTLVMLAKKEPKKNSEE